MELLRDRTAIVTGAAQGIGSAIARVFAEQGAGVLIADVDGDRAASVAEAISRSGGTASWAQCDVTVEDDVEALVDKCLSEHQGLDVYVNNAGVTRDASMANLTVEEFKQVIDVNLLGSWLGTRAALRAMRDTGGGVVINMSSTAGKIGNFGQSNYSAAKAGIVGLTKSAAKEGARHRVRVNAIQPGLIRTTMTSAMRADVWSAKVSEVPLGRAGEPEEVAGVALFLASDLSSYLTGAIIEVTGGRHM